MNKMAKVKITETVLRDSHQSLIATRMTTEEMLPILETMDGIGYHSLEAWGGATFDACMRFLNEDPWERLRKIRDKVKNTKLQMLFRDRRDQKGRRSRPGGDLLYHGTGLHAGVLCRLCKAAGGNGRGFHLHQGYGRASEAL